jgi:hypothetical protein
MARRWLGRCDWSYWYFKSTIGLHRKKTTHIYLDSVDNVLFAIGIWNIWHVEERQYSTVTVPHVRPRKRVASLYNLTRLQIRVKKYVEERYLHAVRTCDDIIWFVKD